jgi:hypothetical protein
VYSPAQKYAKVVAQEDGLVKMLKGEQFLYISEKKFGMVLGLRFFSSYSCLPWGLFVDKYRAVLL